MREMRALLILLLTCGAALGQMFTFVDPGFVGAAKPESGGGVAWDGYPTNQPGVLGWWVADTGYSQSSGYAEWLNLSSQVTNASSINLTNRASGTGAQPASIDSFVNGHKTLYFDGVDDYLISTNFICAQPMDLWVVMQQTNIPTTSEYLLSSSVSSPAIWVRTTGSPARYSIAYGGELSGAAGSTISNAFFVFNVVANSDTSYIYTNGVQLAAGWAGENVQNGFIWGCRYDYASYTFSHSYIPEIIIATNIFDSTARSNITAYLAAKYGITLP